ncbi:MAG: adenine phosphoribosyltransferase [Nitrospinaceae bacterium]|nr:adenine phosphoribosyltransferase [Nitrospinaceae bacterium]NIR53645.1 adenine phosphoribosyltransferase [Nitrospinaceae bacterium]NIS84051.1 adenine phosphoribosyltransferase [Nitrospinaceae bacterium]NIT80852.1 adenine phosphoribosyltransferase [Nitrospinaceae bacterium]NIU43161.1 adenine phosphoribosyltransferase [Nitrospinaceae bacterium]
MEALKQIIRDIPDFPKPGILFKDITPLLGDAVQFAKVVDHLKERYTGKKIDHVVGIEARGFVFAATLAYALGAGCVIVRKPGKLPYQTFSKTYDLEYGTDTVEIHQDALKPGERVVVIDDVLATGGTMAATVDLIRDNFQAELVEAAFLMELTFLNGKAKLQDLPMYAMIQY